MSDDNHFVLLFPATLSIDASHWFFGLRMALAISWADLKIKFIQQYMGEQHLLKNVAVLNDLRQGKIDPFESYYSRFNKNLVDIGKIVHKERL